MPTNVRIVEDLSRLDIIALYRAGALRPGVKATVWLKNGDPGGCPVEADKLGLCVKAAGEEHRLSVEWRVTMTTPFGCVVTVPSFRCPCGSRPRYLYGPSFTCWKCAWRDVRTDWAIRRSHRYIPALHRVVRARKALKVDPHPFGILPEIPALHTRRRKIVQDIHKAEAELVEQARARIQSLTQQAMGLGWAGGSNTTARAAARKRKGSAGGTSRRPPRRPAETLG
jgi:hypothetical protein